MPSERWYWDADRKRFVDRGTGDVVSTTTVKRLRDQYVDARAEAGRALAERVANQSVPIQGWELEFRQQIKETMIAEYLLGRGGRAVMTQRDWGILGALIKEQYRFAHRFAQDIASGLLATADAVASRMALYAGAATEAHEIGKSEAYGMPRLPAYPCDGGTPCLTNCKCAWSISETATQWKATWRLAGGREHCTGCQARAAEYGPLVIDKPGRDS